MKYYPFLNGLRALAVVPVILFHMHPDWCPGGYAGVDVFFVISGFLITGLLMKMFDENSFTLAGFYERRARRILPALFFTCGLCFALAWACFMPEDFKQFSHTLIGVALFASNVSFFEDVGYFAGPALSKPLLHTWSLAVEEQFYILFPLLLMGLHRWSGGKRRTIVLWVAAAFALSLCLSIGLTARYPDASFYFLHTRAWELLVGALVFLAFSEFPLKRLAAESLSLFGSVFLVCGYFLYNRETPFPGAAALLPCLGASLLIWSNLKTPTLVGKLMACRPVAGIGLISYGLYLFHWPLLVFTRYYIERDLTMTDATLLIAATTALATISYFFIETPIRNRQIFVSRRTIFALSLGGLLLVAGAGLAGERTDGFPSRFSGQVLRYLTDDPALLENCNPTKKSKNDRQSWCTIGDAASPKYSFMLWGDSHAGRSAIGLDLVAKKYHQKGIVTSAPGCPPLVGLERTGAEKYSCPPLNEKVISYLRQQKIKDVILVGRWDIVLPREKGSVEDLGTTSSSRVRYRIKDSHELTGLAAFEASFVETVETLNSLGAKVWVMKQVPPNRIYISTALAKAAYWGRDTGTLNRPLSEVLTRRAPIDAIFDKESSLPVTYIDPVDIFCADGRLCLVSDDGRALYHDDTHLSNYGSIWSKDMWDQVFRSIKDAPQ